MASQNNTSYKLPVVDTISTAWEKVKGSKSTFWAAIGVLVAIMFALGFAQGILDHIAHPLGALASLVVSIINLILQVGLVYIGIMRAANKSISYQLLFKACNKTTASSVIGLYVLKFLIFLGPVALAIAGVLVMNSVPFAGIILMAAGFVATVYLSLKLFLGLAFVLDKNAKPLDAVKMSFRVTKGNVLNLLGISLLQLLIFIVAALPLGIGLIWAIPLGLIIYGTVYKRLTDNT